MRSLGKIFLAAVFLLSAMLGSEAQAAHKDVKRVDVDALPEWKVETADTGGTLLFSDSPEEVKENGILYSDKVEGKTRLFYYHTNATKKPKKIVAVIENLTTQRANITVDRYAMTGPSKDYLAVGKTAQKEYFSEKNMMYITLKPKESKAIHPQMNQLTIKKDELVHGIFEFDAKVPVRITVAMMSPEDDPAEFLQTAKILPKDKHRLRGTFTGMNRIVKSDKQYDPKKHGIVAVTLSDGVLDRYRTGIDATDGSITENYGNYGILYSINLSTKGIGQTNYYLCPRGGVYAGALGVRHNPYEKMQMVQTPWDKEFFGTEKKVDETAFLGSYDNNLNLWFDFSPPGASNLPVRLILAPHD